MAESLLDMEKLEHLINLEERLRLHPNLKAIYDTVMFELLDVNEACTKQVEARKKAEKEKAEAAAKLAAEKQAAAEADARARAQADADYVRSRWHSKTRTNRIKCSHNHYDRRGPMARHP
jgi:hypothetical protein